MIARILGLVGRGFYWLGLVAIVGFLLAPALLTVILSFANDPAIQFPPQSWGFRRYQTLLAAPSWGDAVTLSIWLGVVVGTLSVLVAVPAVFALNRTKLPGARAFEFLGILPLLIPQTAYAIGMYIVIAGVGLLGTPAGLAAAHTAICFPLVFIITRANMARLSTDLELVAMTLGAPRWRAWIGITLRLLLPAVISGFLFAFLTSFDEAVFVSFLTGPGLVTLPKAIFDSVRLGVDPAITAIATLLIAFTASVMGINFLVRGRMSDR